MSDLTGWVPCERPALSSLKGHFAELQQYNQLKHAEPLWQALGGVETNRLIQYFPNGPFANASELSRWLQANNDSGDYYTMVINSAQTAEVTGMASYMRIDPANGSVEVGAVAHGPKMARSPIATEAQYLLAKHIFEDLGYRRYEWKLNAENEASHKAAKRLGFTYEGTFRQHIVAKGKNRDTAWYSIIDKEWPLIKDALESWLNPGNFDKSGNQLSSLQELRAQLAQEQAAN